MRYTLFAGILIFLATIKIIATLFGWEQVSALASMTNLTPAMKVFTAHKGYETYSSTFVIEASYEDGLKEKKTLTSELYAHLKGPYNRRNVYGALIAYGPLLSQNPKTAPMYEAMSQYAFCNGIVRFALVEDIDKKLHYAPLQGETLKEKQVPMLEDETIILYTEKEVFYKSDAVIYTLELLGGVWLVLAKLMKVFPKVFRDFVYEGIGKIRYMLAGKIDKEACPILPTVYRERMLS